MEHLFISRPGKLRERWRDVFPGASVVAAVTADPGEVMCWLDTSFMGRAEIDKQLESLLSYGRPTAVLSPSPSEEEASHVMASGARAYCHLMTPPQTMKQIESVLANGGVWLVPGLMSELLKLSSRALEARASESSDLSVLTSREFMVAQLIAKGAKNREISVQLDISERTVKAHLTAIFEKLAVRDRVQLAIKVHEGLYADPVK